MDVSRSIAAHWDGRAATFDDEVDHGLIAPAARAAWSARLSTWLPDPPAHVADLGCGTGSLAILLAARGHPVAACDISPEMVDRARRKAAAAGVAIDLVVADAAAAPLGERCTDVVLVRHLAWTLPDPHAAIERWASMLRPHGRLVMVEGRWGQPDPVGPGGEGGATDDGDYAAVRHALPWYGGVAADQLIPVLERIFPRIEHHDLTGEDDLWGRAVSDERYAVVAHLDA